MIIYSRTALATDSEGNLTRITTVGPEQNEVKVSDQTGNEYLEQILEQIRILNFQMATITENFVDSFQE